jgi:hypothetical protein
LRQIGTLEKRHGFRTADTTIPIRIRSSKIGIKSLRVIRHNNRSEKTTSRLTLNAVSVMIHCNNLSLQKQRESSSGNTTNKPYCTCLTQNGVPHQRRGKVKESKEKIMKSKRS